MAYIRRFEEIFKKEKNKEDVRAFRGSKEDHGQTLTDDQIEKKKSMDVPGFFFSNDANDARLNGGPFITEVRLHMKNIIQTNASYKMKRPDARYMINKSPTKDEVMQKWDEDPREADFKVVDFVMKSHSQYDGFVRIWKEFYQGNDAQFVSNMSKLGYDGIIVEVKNDLKRYIVFNKKAIVSVVSA